MSDATEMPAGMTMAELRLFLAHEVSSCAVELTKASQERKPILQGRAEAFVAVAAAIDLPPSNLDGTGNLLLSIFSLGIAMGRVPS